MYALILFFVFFIVSTVESSQGYVGRKDVIRGGRSYFHGIGVNSKGTILISNPCNSKVVICFAGRSGKGYYYGPGINNPVSVLDLDASMNKPFKKISELDNNIPVSAVDLADNNMVLIAHDKNIYIFADPEHDKGMLVSLISNIWYICRHFFSYPRPKSVLQKISQLHPERCDDEDKIIAIESSNSCVIAVSEKGSITIWPRKDREVLEQQKKIARCEQSVSSVAFDRERNILYLGCSFGKVFVVDTVSDPVAIRIISAIPDTWLRINCMNFSKDQLLCAALCDCYKINCCREGYSWRKNAPAFCLQCEKNGISSYATSLCSHRLDYINRLPLFCNCHPNGHAFFPFFSVLKKINIGNNDMILKIIGMVFKMKVDGLCYGCNNKYAILSREQLNGKDIQPLNPIFDVDSKVDCCKKIALLPNGKLVMHTFLCKESDDKTFEKFKIVDCNNGKNNAQPVCTVVKRSRDERCVHLKQDGERVHILFEMYERDYNQQVVFNTWYAPEGSRSIVKDIVYTYRMFIASQSYFAFVMKGIIESVSLFAGLSVAMWLFADIWSHKS